MLVIIRLDTVKTIERNGSLYRLKVINLIKLND